MFSTFHTWEERHKALTGLHKTVQEIGLSPFEYAYDNAIRQHDGLKSDLARDYGEPSFYRTYNLKEKDILGMIRFYLEEYPLLLYNVYRPAGKSPMNTRLDLRSSVKARIIETLQLLKDEASSDFILRLREEKEKQCLAIPLIHFEGLPAKGIPQQHLIFYTNGRMTLVPLEYVEHEWEDRVSFFTDLRTSYELWCYDMKKEVTLWKMSRSGSQFGASQIKGEQIWGRVIQNEEMRKTLRQHMIDRSSKTKGIDQFKYIQLLHLIEFLPNIRDPTYFLGVTPRHKGNATIPFLFDTLVPFAIARFFEARNLVETPPPVRALRRQRASHPQQPASIELVLKDFSIGATTHKFNLFTPEEKCIQCGSPAFYDCPDEECSIEDCQKLAKNVIRLPQAGVRFFCDEPSHNHPDADKIIKRPVVCLRHKKPKSTPWLRVIDSDQETPTYREVLCSVGGCTDRATKHLTNITIPEVCDTHSNEIHSITRLFNEKDKTIEYQSPSDPMEPEEVDRSMKTWLPEEQRSDSGDYEEDDDDMEEDEPGKDDDSDFTCSDDDDSDDDSDSDQSSVRSEVDEDSEDLNSVILGSESDSDDCSLVESHSSQLSA